MTIKKLVRRTRSQSIFLIAWALTLASLPAAQGDEGAPTMLVSDYFSQKVAEDPVVGKMIEPIAFEFHTSDQVNVSSECDAQAGGDCFNDCCVSPWWAHRTGIFAEFLLLRPGSTDLIYAVEQTDPDADIASPTGPVGIVAIPEQGGFRTGFTLAASDCSSYLVSYARWDGSTTSEIEANFPFVLDSQVVHPSVDTSGAASLAASSYQKISFQTVDLAYRHLWKASNTTALNWLTGLRYGNIEQRSSTDQIVQTATGLTNVATDIDFDGFGITGGLDFERYHCRTGLSLYGKSMLSLLAGEWTADYEQVNQFGGGVIANGIEDFRIIPVAEAELGLKWSCLENRLSVHGGLLVSAWFDSMTTRSYIGGVRSGQIQDIDETMTFSGLTTGVAWRF